MQRLDFFSSRVAVHSHAVMMVSSFLLYYSPVTQINLWVTLLKIKLINDQF